MIRPSRLISAQVEVFHHACDRVSSAAELYGAVQQEARISRAIDVMLMHVDNVKRMCDKQRTDLEEAKRFETKAMSMRSIEIQSLYRDCSFYRDRSFLKRS